MFFPTGSGSLGATSDIQIPDIWIRPDKFYTKTASWAWRWTASTPSDVQGMTLNCIHIFIVTGSFLNWCVMKPASQRFFIHNCIYLRILIIYYLATFLGTNSLSVLMCCKAVNQSIIHKNSLLASCRSRSTGCSERPLGFPSVVT